MCALAAAQPNGDLDLSLVHCGDGQLCPWAVAVHGEHLQVWQVCGEPHVVVLVVEGVLVAAVHPVVGPHHRPAAAAGWLLAGWPAIEPESVEPTLAVAHPVWGSGSVSGSGSATWFFSSACDDVLFKKLELN